MTVSGPEVTVITADGRHLCRNKSYFKKVPFNNEDDDGDGNYTTSQNNGPHIVVADRSDCHTRKYCRKRKKVFKNQGRTQTGFIGLLKPVRIS